jgi:hypothetical protein
VTLPFHAKGKGLETTTSFTFQGCYTLTSISKQTDKKLKTIQELFPGPASLSIFPLAFRNLLLILGIMAFNLP